MIVFQHVASARLYWENQYGRRLKEKPAEPTWQSNPLSLEKVYGSDMTQRDMAVSQGRVDTWRPVAEFTTSGHHKFVLTDAAAIKTFSNYRRWKFGVRPRDLKRKEQQLCLPLS